MSTPNDHQASNPNQNTATTPQTFVRDDLIAHVNQLILQGQFQAAWSILEQWNIQYPQDALTFVFAANIMRREQNWQRAIELSNQALQIEPNFYPAMLEKARVYADKKDFPLACHSYLNIYEYYPNILEYCNEWSDALIQIADYKTLLDVVNLQLMLGQPSADAYFKAGLAHQYLFEHDKAIPFYEKLMSIDPNYHMLRNNLGAAYKETKQLDKAKVLLEEEIQYNSSNFMAMVNYSSILQKQDDLEGALQYVQKAIELEPNYAISYNNLCLAQRELQQFEAAVRSAEQAVLIDPHYDSAKWNLAMSYLQLGRYTEGLQMHEFRWNGSGELRGKPHNLPVPEYDGTQNLFGKTVFIWGEQGFGDAMQFARYIPLMVEKLKKQGAIVKYCCFTMLQDLFTESFQYLFEDTIVDDKQRPLPDFDYHLPLLKIPLLMQTTLETIPNTVPYLKPTPQARQKWHDRLKTDTNLKVGLVWTGSLNHQRNPYRAVGIEAYIPFKALENISFYNLQFHAEADLAIAKAAGLELIDYTPEISDFNQSAALIQELDLVITVCTSVSHLAGALGVNTWVLLDTNPHWVWLLEREDSPWYPKTKLYRQTHYRQWQSVLDRVFNDLKGLALVKAEQKTTQKSEKAEKADKLVSAQSVSKLDAVVKKAEATHALSNKGSSVKGNTSAVSSSTATATATTAKAKNATKIVDANRIQLQEQELLELNPQISHELKAKTKKAPPTDKAKQKAMSKPSGA